MKKLLFFIFCIYTTTVQAQPAGYYTSALGKNGVQLQSELKNIIDNHSVQSYPLWSAFSSTDNKGNNVLWDMYSDVPGGTSSYTYTLVSDQCGQYNSEGDCYNHEHVWPKNYFNDASPMNSDLHHIIPTDGWVNNKRANFPIGEVSSVSWTGSNGSRTGSSNSYVGYSGNVFEPIDAYKGDIARMYFYMSTRYKGEDNSWNNWEMANKAVLTSDAIQMLLQWHADDTVSQKEIDRNNAIYNIQGNRNPFVDYPIFANCIWGTADCTPLNIQEVLQAKIELYPNPSKDEIIVRLPNALQNQSVVFEVYNVYGQKVLASKQYKIYIKDLLHGMYTVRILTEKDVYSTHFIKE